MSKFATSLVNLSCFLQNVQAPVRLVANFAEAPLYFVRSGIIDMIGIKLWNPGFFGKYWSLWANSNPGGANYLYLNDSFANPSGSNYRYDAFPLRCLAS